VIWLQFIICGLIILFAGTKLARYGDIIAEKTGLGRIWIGLILIAVITSAPEMITGISSVVLVKQPDMALGTLLGSICFNLVIVVVIDIMYKKEPVLSAASRRQMVPAAGGLVLYTLAFLGIVFSGSFGQVSVGWVSLPSLLILLGYVAVIYLMFRVETDQSALEKEAEKVYGHESSRRVWIKFVIAAAAVVGTGVWLALVGDQIATTYPAMNASFVGSLFLAICTSLPELVVAIAAVRIGAVDMAIADILGANLLDVGHTFTIDLVTPGGTIQSMLSRVNLVTLGIAFAMTVVLLLSLKFRARRKLFGLFGWYTPVLFALYLTSAYLLFRGGLG
jgi:cation:H+ antiporter